MDDTNNLNPSLTPEARDLFTDMLRESGMPVTEEAMREQWNICNVAEKSPFTNDSQWSPFWRLVTAIATKPAKWVVNLLVEHSLPNTFLRFASSVWLDLYAWGVDVTRKGSRPAEGELEFVRAAGTASEIIIRAGTVIESPPLEGRIYRVVTLADASIPEGAESALISVRAEEHGEAYNLGPGYYSILPKPVTGVGLVRNGADWLQQPGADVEQDEPLRLRCRNQFAAVGQYHHDAAYRAVIASFAGIRVDYIFFEKDAPRGPGTANAHIMIESGIPPLELIDSINKHISDSGNHGHGDSMLAMPIREIPIALTVLVYPVVGLGVRGDKAELLRKAVEDRVRCAFRQNTDFAVTRVLPLSRFSFSQLGRELHGQLVDLQSVEFTKPVEAGETPKMWDDIVSLRQLPVLKEFSVVLGGKETA